jgi:hypothetical protein
MPRRRFGLDDLGKLLVGAFRVDETALFYRISKRQKLPLLSEPKS